MDRPTWQPPSLDPPPPLLPCLRFKRQCRTNRHLPPTGLRHVGAGPPPHHAMSRLPDAPLPHTHTSLGREPDQTLTPSFSIRCFIGEWLSPCEALLCPISFISTRAHSLLALPGEHVFVPATGKCHLPPKIHRDVIAVIPPR
jgi:hypothetical protein